MVMVSYWDRGIGPLGTETNSSRTRKVPVVCVPHSPFLAPGDHGPVDSLEGLRWGEQSEKRHRAALVCHYTYLPEGDAWKQSYLKPDHRLTHPAVSLLLGPATLAMYFKSSQSFSCPSPCSFITHGVLQTLPLQHPSPKVCYRPIFLCLHGGLFFAPNWSSWCSLLSSVITEPGLRRFSHGLLLTL